MVPRIMAKTAIWASAYSAKSNGGGVPETYSFGDP